MSPDIDSESGARTAALISAGSATEPPTPTTPATALAFTNGADGGPETLADPQDREARFLDTLAGFARVRQEKSWSGTLSTFLETVVRADPQRCTRTSHQYI